MHSIYRVHGENTSVACDSDMHRGLGYCEENGEGGKGTKVSAELLCLPDVKALRMTAYDCDRIGNKLIILLVTLHVPGRNKLPQNQVDVQAQGVISLLQIQRRRKPNRVKQNQEHHTACSSVARCWICPPLPGCRLGSDCKASPLYVTPAICNHIDAPRQ